MTIPRVVKGRNKAQVADYDFIRSLPDEECLYCLTTQQVFWLLTQTIYAGWLTRWYANDPSDIDTDWLEAFQADLERRLMRDCCDDEPLIRFTDDGDMEVSTDGGQTWQPATANEDYRLALPVNPKLPGSPAPSTFAQCVGANSARSAIEEFTQSILDNETAWETVATLVGIIITAFAAFFGIGAIIGTLVGALVIIVFAIGRTALIASFTAAVWDEFECILYCNIGSDMAFNNTQWEGVKADINSAGFDFGVQMWLWYVVVILGANGLTNAARTKLDLAADCSDCDCEDLCLEPTTSGSQAGANLTDRSGDLGAGWWSVDTVATVGAAPNCYAEITLGCCLLEEYNIQVGITNAPPGNRVAIGCGGSPVHTGDYGVNNCVELVLFRSYEEGEFRFKIAPCT